MHNLARVQTMTLIPEESVRRLPPAVDVLSVDLPDEPLVTIEQRDPWLSIDLAELWRNRELLYFLTWRDIKVRYKQTVLGAAWALMQPFFTMLLFSLFFGRLAKLPSEGIPYAIFCYTALVPWTFFANGLSQSANSLVGNANLITKVYFPRLAVPISAVISGGVDFVVAMGLLILMLWYEGITPKSQIFWAPAFVLLMLITS